MVWHCFQHCFQQSKQLLDCWWTFAFSSQKDQVWVQFQKGEVLLLLPGEFLGAGSVLNTSLFSVWKIGGIYSDLAEWRNIRWGSWPPKKASGYLFRSICQHSRPYPTCQQAQLLTILQCSSVTSVDDRGRKLWQKDSGFSRLPKLHPNLSSDPS